MQQQTNMEYMMTDEMIAASIVYDDDEDMM
jgi:hypothetical protein